MTPIFVFGSNLAGRHGAGAALHARKHHGAKYGVGTGRTGEAYAIPTKDAGLQSLPLPAIAGHVSTFLGYAQENPALQFNVTRIGCGLAGYTDAQIAPLFAGAPANCTLPDGWPALANVASASAAPGRKTDAASPADIPTNVRSSTMSNENTPAADSNRPALRNKDDVALWPAKDGAKHHLSGHITLDGNKVNVIGFINDTDREGNALKQPYVSLSRNTAGEGQPPKWETVATGNAMNHRSDDKPVYFDEMIFNVKGQDKKTFTAFVGKGCPAEFQQQLGFTSPAVERPAKAAPAEEAEEEEAASPRP